MFKKVFTLIILISALLCSNMGFSQDNYKLMSSSLFKVSGTSTLKDWDMNTKKADGKAKVEVKNERLIDIKSLVVVLKGETLESGNSGMNSNAYKALKTKEHPFIKFKLKEVLAVRSNSMRIRGDFTVAGETRTQTFNVRTGVSNSHITISGDFDILFSDYNMTPPTALFGSVKTGNELTISFSTKFGRE